MNRDRSQPSLGLGCSCLLPRGLQSLHQQWWKLWCLLLSQQEWRKSSQHGLGELSALDLLQFPVCCSHEIVLGLCPPKRRAPNLPAGSLLTLVLGVRTLQLWMGCVGMEAQQINVGVRIRDRSVQFYRGGLPNAAGLERAHVCVTGWWKGSEKWLCSLTLPCSSTCTVFWNHSIPKLLWRFMEKNPIPCIKHKLLEFVLK